MESNETDIGEVWKLHIMNVKSDDKGWRKLKSAKKWCKCHAETWITEKLLEKMCKDIG